MGETWYHIGYGNDIKEVAATGEIDKCLYFDAGRRSRVSKRSSYDNYFKTRDEAVAYIIEKLEQKIQSAKFRFEGAKKDLQEFRDSEMEVWDE